VGRFDGFQSRDGFSDRRQRRRGPHADADDGREHSGNLHCDADADDQNPSADADPNTDADGYENLDTAPDAHLHTTAHTNADADEGATPTHADTDTDCGARTRRLISNTR
jgi:hypothetical protein